MNGLARWRRRPVPAQRTQHRNPRYRAPAPGFAAETIPDPALWHACRSHEPSRLDDLAQRIEPAAPLGRPGPARGADGRSCAKSPPTCASASRSIDDWGFARKGAARPGHQRAVRRRERHRQDHGRRGAGQRAATWTSTASTCPPVVSKYIGETEKNLRRVFDAAEDERRHPAVRRGRRPVRQAQRGAGTATTATPTSRSATCCSAWRPTAAWPS